MRATSLLVAAALAVNACQRNPAPQYWLPTPLEAPAWEFGGWIELEMTRADPKAGPDTLAGELLAVAPDSVWIMTDAGAVAAARADVALATLIGWDPETGKLGLWTGLGTLSTLANGYFLLFTAPAWIIAGSLATASQSKRPVIRTDRAEWHSLRLYARFPQGLPRGVDLTALGKLVR